jgi:hypothetical protein
VQLSRLPTQVYDFWNFWNFYKGRNYNDQFTKSQNRHIFTRLKTDSGPTHKGSTIFYEKSTIIYEKSTIIYEKGTIIYEKNTIIYEKVQLFTKKVQFFVTNPAAPF